MILTEGFLIEVVSNSEQDTFALGKKIAALLAPGSVVALNGTLGSGKTSLAKGIAAGLGITENLTSPTYTIINEYKRDDPSSPLYHIDLYRLSDAGDFENIGGGEIIYSKGISLIEWSERILKSLPEETISVSLEITGNSSRTIKISGAEKL